MRLFPTLGLGGVIAALSMTAGIATAQTAAPDGAKIFARCAACHGGAGNGVPGAFPPLQADFRTLAAKAPGRRYVALAVIRGVAGPIMVDGKSYRGFMPAQPLDDTSVAAVLNHVGGTIAKSGPAFKPFTAAEIAGIRAGGATLSGADVGKLHVSAGGQ